METQTYNTYNNGGGHIIVGSESILAFSDFIINLYKNDSGIFFDITKDGKCINIEFEDINILNLYRYAVRKRKILKLLLEEESVIKIKSYYYENLYSY